MNYSLEELSHLNSEELERIIQQDAEGDGQLIFDLEAELMSILGSQVFADSETFNDLDEETPAEKTIRVLVESLDFRNTLSAILALHDLVSGADL